VDRKIKERAGSMRSVFNWRVLGLLIERPSYGWELWTRFERLYSDTRVGSSPGIYSALDALYERGLTEVVSRTDAVKPIDIRQTKPHYRATPEGHEAYEEWMIEQMREHHHRLLEFGRYLGAFSGQPEIALRILDRYEEACLAEKGGAIPIAAEFPTHVVPGLGDRLASKSARSVVAAALDWVEYARAEFSALASRQR
jgi:DNA-binding PadR family transcriptional regulator